VRGAIDRKLSGGASLLTNAELLSRAETVRASNQIWMVSQNPGEVVARNLPKDGPGLHSQFASILQSMQSSTVGLDLMNGLALRAGGLFRTAGDAKTLADAVRGLVAIGRLSVPQNEPDLVNLLDGIRVEERGAEVELSVEVSQEVLDKFLEKNRSRGTVRAVRVDR